MFKIDKTIELHRHQSCDQIHNEFSISAQLRLKTTHISVMFQVSHHKHKSWNDCGLLYSKSEDLWKESCFELFLKSDQRYWEWNFLPSGKSRSYVFENWRHCVHNHTRLERQLSITAHPNSFSIEAKIPTTSYPLLAWELWQGNHSTLKFQLACILSDSEGKSYWSSKANAKNLPDFHTSEAFMDLV